MLKKIFKRNSAIFIVIIVSFILFCSVLFYGTNETYKQETEKQQIYLNQRLLVTSENIKAQFADFKNDLLLLRDLPNTQKYVNSNFKNKLYEKNTQQAFYAFAQHNKKFYHLRIIDKTGYETIEVDNLRDGSTVIIPNNQLQSKKNRYYFADTMRLKQHQIYLSPIDLDVDRDEIEIPHTPVIRTATPLYNSQHEKIGIIMLSMYFNQVIHLLHPNMFIKTAQGNILFTNPKSASKNIIYTRPNELDFTLSKKNMSISSKKVTFMPNNYLYVGIYYDKHYSQKLLFELILITATIFILFLCMILFIAYFIIEELKKLIQAQKAIIYSLTKLTELRDPTTGQHLEKTTQYAIALAKQLQKNKKYSKIVTDDFIEDLNDAAFLHDIGKVGMRDALLFKKDKLTAEEMKEMQKHPQIAKQELDRIIKKFDLTESFLQMASNICCYHHEKYDGTGYPQGLKENQIPIEARIFALADAYDAIRSKRPYKPELSHQEAIERIIVDKGKHFDPDVVDAFVQCEQEFLQISEQNT